jgi:hypothetical protein
MNIRALGRDEILIHTHIRKTAGTSLYRFLLNHFGFQGVMLTTAPFDTLGRFVELRSAGTLRAVAGHIPYGAHRWLGIERPWYMAVLRNPMRRLVSEYHYFHTHPTQPWSSVVRHMTSVEQYITWDQRDRNHMARTLSPGGRLEGDTAELLRRVRRDYAFIGFFERMTDTVDALAQALGGTPVTFPLENRGDYGPADDACLTYLAERYRHLDAIDHALYEELAATA